MGGGDRARPRDWASRAPTRSSTGRSRPSAAVSCPHFAGINTFLKAPYVEDVRRAGEFDVAVFGAPFDGGTTYRSGTRFGPQGIRKISALYGPYSFELGVDLRESITMCRPRRHLHDPGNIEKTFDQISKAVAHVYETRRLPDRPRRRPLDRLPDGARRRREAARRQARHHPLRPPRRHPGDRPGRAHAHDALVPRHRHPQRARRRTSCRSASAAGRRRAPA